MSHWSIPRIFIVYEKQALPQNTVCLCHYSISSHISSYGTSFGRNGNFVMRTSWVTFTRSYFVLLIYHVLFFCIKIYTSVFRISNWEVFREKNQVFSFTPLDLLRPQYEKFYKTGKLNLGSFADIINKLYSITLQRQIYK